MYENFLIIYFIISVFLIVFILMYPSSGMDTKDYFNNQNVSKFFNIKKSGNFVSRSIIFFAILFFIISLFLNNFNNNKKLFKNKLEKTKELDKKNKNL